MNATFKVLEISNFGDESFCEKEIVGPYLTEDEAERIATILNERVTESSRGYHKAYPKDRVLWRGMADLVGEPTNRPRLTLEGLMQETVGNPYVDTVTLMEAPLEHFGLKGAGE